MATTPSIAMIPSGYKDEKVYSVLPTNGDGDFTFARTSTATRVNSNGLIEEVAVNAPRLDYSDGACPSLLLEPTSTNLIQYSEEFANGYWTKSGSTVQGDPSTAGTEEVTNGDFATDSDWTKASAVTIGGGQCTFTANSTTQSLIQGSLWAANSLSGKTVQLTYTIISNSLNAGDFRIGGYTGASAFTLTNLPTEVGTHSVTLDVRTSAGDDNAIDLYITSAATSGALVIDNVSVKEVQGFASPSGDTNAFKLVESATTTTHRLLSNNFSVISGNTYTLSFFIKKGETNFFQILFGSTGFGNTHANFDLNLGEVGDLSGVNASSSITSFANDWYKCTITADSNLTTSSALGIALPISSKTAVRQEIYTGDGTSGVYIYGAQVEQQSYATSYIKNEGDANGITRAADSATGSGDATVINSTEGTLYFEGIATNPGVSANSQISISSATNSGDNRVMITPSSDTQLTLRFNAGGTQLVTQAVTVSSLSVNSKIAVRWGNGNYSLYQNGSPVYTQAIASTPIGLAKLNFSSVTETNNFNGKVKDLRVYATALSNEELTTLTTI